MARLFIITMAFVISFTSAARQLTVYTAGFGDDAASVVAKAEFFASHLGIVPSKPMTLIILSSQALPDHISGLMEHEENETMQMLNVMIKIKAGLPAAELDLVLAHEMVHVAQYAKGDLVKMNDRMFRWKGQLVFDAPQIPYNQRTWEKEALSKECTLVKAFERHQKARLETDLAQN